MNYYIINTAYDFADEFDYPVVSVMTELERQYIIDSYNKWKEYDYSEIYFGTNEALSFHPSDILTLVKQAECVSSDTYKIIQPYLPVCGVDIVEYVLDNLEYLRDS